MECVTLIDISSEDDLLIPSSSHGLGSKTFSNLVAENTEKMSKQMEQLSELSESPQQKRRRSDRYSLRKSLAWDSEFFTSEGVLNAEELEIINSTYSKAIGLKLPGIHEELRKSAESSTSTLDSESRELENLEVHLFENLRASSKRSLVASNQTANMEHSGKAKEQRKPNKPHLRNLKKLDISSQTMVASRNGQSRSSNKSTEISSTPPLRAVHGKCSSPVVNKQIKNNRGMVLPGITAKRQAGLALNKSTNDPGMASRPIIPSKESSLRTPQSSSRPANSSSDSSSSRLAIMRNSSINAIRSSSSFSNKTPLKTTRSRTGPKNQICISSSGKSTLLLSKVSPSSSIDSFLSESSSLTSNSTKHSNSFKGSNGGLSSSASIPVSAENVASQKSGGGAISQSFTGNHSKITSKIHSDTRGTPSIGLRMPRPRIGFFDKEKTLLHGSNKYLQTSLAKNSGISEASAANKSKPINPPLMRSGAHPYSLNHTSKSTGRQMVLNPKYDVMENRINESGEQRINDQSFLMKSTEKENLCPASKTVTMLEGMVASLSLSEVKDNILRD